jgi:Uma2 family endonuclease
MAATATTISRSPKRKHGFPTEQCILLDNISWATYEALLEEMGERQIRLTYDDGSLEIMALSFGHEKYGSWIGRLIEMLSYELEIPICCGGSTTLKRKLKKKGLEPDECYWIQNEAKMNFKDEFDAKSDPPPDLAVEIDKTHSSLDRMPIYAALGVPEVWRFNGKKLLVYRLVEGSYEKADQSGVLPFLPLEKFAGFILKRKETREFELLQSFVSWVRKSVLPAYKASRKQ